MNRLSVFVVLAATIVLAHRSHAAAKSVDWPVYLGGKERNLYSELDQINRDNVADLKGVWRTHLNGSGLGTQYSAEGTPLYKDGKLYIDFRGFRAGTAYSTVLEKSDTQP